MEVEQLQIIRPHYWNLDAALDPYHVRAKHKSIAHAIEKKLRMGTYCPNRPAGYYVPKPSGGERLVSTFGVADEVISRRLFASLMSKNSSKLSSRAYAYRYDLTPHDAIDYISSEFKQNRRIFIAEFDFSKFFDKVSHEHLWETLSQLGIRMTGLERRCIRSFLTVPGAYTNVDEKEINSELRSVGFPQGTSLSLFLANVAVAPLDRAFEKLGVSFARYADDTLIWSEDYSKICKAVDSLQEASEAMGSPINYGKSEGIRLLVPSEQREAEMRSTVEFDYLGHQLSLDAVRMKRSAVQKIKARVLRLIYTNLLMAPLLDTQSLSRLSDLDNDYITYIWQLRRYLYGNLSERDLNRYATKAVSSISFKGVMSYFPLVDNDSRLEELDSWIATQTWLALRKRARMLETKVSQAPKVWNLTREDLIKYEFKSINSASSSIDLRIPSARRMVDVIGKAVETYGLSIMGPGKRLYNYGI